MFAFAARAAARFRQLPAIAEHIAAVRTRGGFEDETAAAVPCDRLGDVVEMVFDLALGNAEHLRQLIGRQPGVGQELDEALARRAFWKRHGAIMVRQSVGAMQNLFPGRKK